VWVEGLREWDDGVVAVSLSGDGVCTQVPYDISLAGLVAVYFSGVGFCTQGPYDIPLRGLPVTFL